MITMKAFKILFSLVFSITSINLSIFNDRLIAQENKDKSEPYEVDKLVLLLDNWRTRTQAAWALRDLLLLVQGKVTHDEAEGSIRTLQNYTPGLRIDIAHATKELANPKIKEYVVESLINTLEQKITDINIREISRALAAAGDKKAIKVLKKKLRYWKAERAIIWAYFALYMLGESDVLKHLHNYLKDNYPDARMNAAQALGEIGDNSSVELLIELLKDSHYGVRLHAVIALGQLRDERAIEPLMKLYHNDPNEYVRKDAYEALNKIKIKPKENSK